MTWRADRRNQIFMVRNVQQINIALRRGGPEDQRPFSDFAASQNVVLLGDPGSGKSHLFRETAVAEGARFVTARARAIAKTAKNASAMVAATTLKARLCGLLVDRIEDMVAREKLAAERESIGEVRKAGQLLAEAAKSLDLPERATPAQIVGALAAREFITPEAFVLLHASRTVNDGVV
jgi:chromosomal replication initiation ATPase DnaA